ncbi:hypothetical protein ACIQLJ_13615 [Microbacterium sp. NPDC091313]
MSPQDEGALLLLALSTSALAIAVFAGAIEVTLLASIGRLIVAGAAPGNRALIQASISTIRLAPLTIVAFSALAGIYFIASPKIDWSNGLAFFLPAMMTGPIASASAPYSAALFANRRLGGVYLSAGIRTLPVIISVALSCPPLILGFSIVLGELLRSSFLIIASQRALQSHGSELKLETDGLRAQVLSNALGQGMPAIVQAMLASVGPIAVTQGAIALRIFSVANQIVTSGLAMPAVTELPRIVSASRERSLRQVLRRELIRVAGPALVLAVLLSATIVVVTQIFVIDEQLSNGAIWSVPLLAALAAVTTNFWAGRALVLAKQARILPYAAAIGLGIGALFGFAMMPVLGGQAPLVGLALSLFATATINCTTLFRRGETGLTLL